MPPGARDTAVKKVVIVYWSGTGNTAAMARLVKKGVIEGGAANVVGAVIAYDYPDAAAEKERIGLGKDVVETLA